MTPATCIDAWNGVLQQPPGVNPGFSPGTSGWGALAGGVGGTLCGYVCETDTTPIRLIVYDTTNGSVSFLVF